MARCWRAAEDFYGLKDIEYDWQSTIRYMGIFHGAQPKDKALQCLDCHREDGRMDWVALGYETDPLQNIFDAQSVAEERE